MTDPSTEPSTNPGANLGTPRDVPFNVPAQRPFRAVTWRPTERAVFSEPGDGETLVQTGVVAGEIEFPDDPLAPNYSLNFPGVLEALNGGRLARRGMTFARDELRPHVITFTLAAGKRPLDDEEWKRAIMTGGGSIATLYRTNCGFILVSCDVESTLVVVEYRSIGPSYLAITLNGPVLVGTLKERLRHFLMHQLLIGAAVDWADHGVLLYLGDNTPTTRYKAAIAHIDTKDFLAGALKQQLGGDMVEIVEIVDLPLDEEPEVGEDTGSTGVHLHRGYLVVGDQAFGPGSPRPFS